ncbi:MAG: c-type cytochrome [Lacibacter sp.]
MKKPLTIFFVTIAVIVTSFTLPAYNNISTSNIKSDSIKDILALYGEYVFNREKCNRCHTLSFTETDKIRLDGQGGKSPNAWHVMHILDPESMIPKSKMPPFKHLGYQEISKTKLLELASQYDNNILTDTTKLYQNLAYELSSFEKSIETINPFIDNISNKEIISLVIFIQQIPSSIEKKKQDSIQSKIFLQQDEETLRKWQQQISDKESDLNRFSKSKNKDIINEGQTLFSQTCSTCHGNEGQGSIGPNFRDNYWLHGSSIKNILHTILEGVPDRGMISWRYTITPEQAGKIIAYIKSINGKRHPGEKEPQGKKE